MLVCSTLPFTPCLCSNNDSSFDISISLMLTERTLVSEVDGALHVKNIPEPPPPEPVTRPVELYINGELVSKWDE